MKNDAAAIKPANCTPALSHHCPVCQGELRRTWRRPVDRFASLFVSVHRYRCGAFSCQWEGNFRVHTSLADAKPLSTNVPVLIAVACSASAVLVVIALGSQWPYGVSRAHLNALDDKQFASFKLTPSDPDSTHVIELQVGPRHAPVAKAK